MEDFSLEDINTVVHTNVLGSIYPVHAILPQLKLRSRDHPISVVFIGSLASLVRKDRMNEETLSKVIVLHDKDAS